MNLWIGLLPAGSQNSTRRIPFEEAWVISPARCTGHRPTCVRT